LRRIPIFDTNIFGHVRDGSIHAKDWRFLLRHRPGHGWTLSFVTALELLAGLSTAPAEKFFAVKEQIELGYKLSKGRRVPLDEPRFLFCKEVLGTAFPAELGYVRPEVIGDHMEVVRCAKSSEEIRSGRVPVRRLRTQGYGRPGYAGFDASIIEELMGGQNSPKKEWVERREAFASDIYPQWREHFQATGKRLPDEKRSAIEPVSVWRAERLKFHETFLEWLEVTPTPDLHAETAKRLDAVFEFTLFVDRAFLLQNYNPEKNESDVYDQFQLHYLALDRFVIVTEDVRLRERTAGSSQAGRILSFDQFLRTL
jgi:hypothetical protein